MAGGLHHCGGRGKGERVIPLRAEGAAMAVRE